MAPRPWRRCVRSMSVAATSGTASGPNRIGRPRKSHPSKRLTPARTGDAQRLASDRIADVPGVPLESLVPLTNGDKLRPFDDILQDIVISALGCCHGNKTQAADRLGISHTRFYRILGGHRKKKSAKRKT